MGELIDYLFIDVIFQNLVNYLKFKNIQNLCRIKHKYWLLRYSPKYNNIIKINFKDKIIGHFKDWTLINAYYFNHNELVRFFPGYDLINGHNLAFAVAGGNLVGLQFILNNKHQIIPENYLKELIECSIIYNHLHILTFFVKNFNYLIDQPFVIELLKTAGEHSYFHLLLCLYKLIR